ncbi:MAG: DUF2298 domain-containing protein [Anaerolineae bacterium]
MVGATFEWIGREGGLILSWWLIVTLAGAAAWPLTFRLLRGLPDRGYALARSAGLIVIGYVFWLLASLGLLANTSGNIVLAALFTLGIGLALMVQDAPARAAMREWFATNWKYALFVEGLFAALFVGWVAFRAMNPALTGTEKPMEVAFTSAIQRSLTFPPNDPWMSGYSISYYYFGYVLAAALAKLSGASSAVAFNLMVPLLFALTGTGVFGVVYNLLRSRFLGHRRKGALHPTPRATAVLFGVLGLIFVVLLGNLHTVFVELPYETGTASAGYLQFWDEEQRDAPKVAPAPSVNQWEFWWWFRASRVIRDHDLNGAPSAIQPIDEFPAFSFVLADMHPHVLALPFAVLALAVALSRALSPDAPGRYEVILYGVVFGALIFLNTWDGPIYMALLVGAEALRRLAVNADGRLRMDDWRAIAVLGVAVVGLAVVCYLPFLIGFRSQLGGVLPNVIHPTRIHQFFLMFGPFLLILLFYLGVEIWRGQEELNWRLGFSVLGFAVLGLALVMLVLGLIAWSRPEVRGVVFAALDAAGGTDGLFGRLLRIRVGGLPVLILLLGMVVVVVARLFGRPAIDEDETPYAVPTGFVLMVIGAGALLALLPDYLYLRDNFGVRINTVFKFYYQVWLLWGIASAYAAYSILADVEWHLRPGTVVRVLFGGVLALVVVSGLLYTVLAVYTRAVVEPGRLAGDVPLTLDGGPTLATPDDYAALRCLESLVGDRQVTLVEAVGSAYRPDLGGRVSALTGIPTVLAWEGHERQWRGLTYSAVAGMRAEDVQRLYSDPSWAVVQDVVFRYGIDYVFVGAAEQGAYDSFGLPKFEANLTPVCRSGGTAVYQIDRR